MTIDERNILIEKSKSRKDGVYSYKDNLYVVRNNNLIAFADYFGECYQCAGAFNIKIGRVARHDRRQHLVRWLNSNNK